MIYGYKHYRTTKWLSPKSRYGTKQKHGYEGELKWTNISTRSFALYNEIVDYFFMTNMKFYSGHRG